MTLTVFLGTISGDDEEEVRVVGGGSVVLLFAIIVTGCGIPIFQKTQTNEKCVLALHGHFPDPPLAVITGYVWIGLDVVWFALGVIYVFLHRKTVCAP